MSSGGGKTGGGGGGGGGSPTAAFGDPSTGGGIDPGPELAAVQGRYDQLGLGNSTMATQDQNATLERVENENQQTQLQQALALENLNGSGGFQAGANSVTGGGGGGGGGSNVLGSVAPLALGK